ncbi:hypothetical protein ABZ079_27040 [Streptomyces sp. NPDC006314]|uniref:hypothetical protein n=1 Tax=Streptomyces sp. NPDC006314 TaxID=3154475 RepID=UPI0033AD2F45
MTVGAGRCARVLETAEATGTYLAVAFAHRFHPVHETPRRPLEVRTLPGRWLDAEHDDGCLRLTATSSTAP